MDGSDDSTNGFDADSFVGLDGGFAGSGGGLVGFDGFDGGVVGVGEAVYRAKKRWKTR